MPGVLTDKNLVALTEFLDRTLPKLTQVDLENLKSYILALLTKEGTREQIKADCVTELHDFFENGTEKSFVQTMFDKIDELDGRPRRSRKRTPSRERPPRDSRRRESAKSSGDHSVTRDFDIESPRRQHNRDRGRKRSRDRGGPSGRDPYSRSSMRKRSRSFSPREGEDFRVTTGDGGRSVRSSRHSRKRRKRDRPRDSRKDDRGGEKDLISESDLRRLIKEHMNDDECKEILDNPKLLREYVELINQEGLEGLGGIGGSLGGGGAPGGSKPILPLPPFGLAPAPDPPAAIRDNLRAQVRRISHTRRNGPKQPKERRLPPPNDPFFQPKNADSVLNNLHPDLARNPHVQRMAGKMQPQRSAGRHRNIFVRGIPPNKNKILLLADFFKKFGDIENLQVHSDQYKAFVQFGTPAQAAKCIEECSKSVVLDDPRIKVQWAFYNRPDYERNKHAFHGGPGSFKPSSSNRNVFGDGFVNMGRSTNSLYSSNIADVGLATKIKPKRATLSGLDQSKISNPIKFGGKVPATESRPGKGGDAKSDAQAKKAAELRKKAAELMKKARKKAATLAGGKAMKPESGGGSPARTATPKPADNKAKAKILDDAIAIAKKNRDEQLTMWEKLLKVKGKAEDKKKMAKQLEEGVEALNKKIKELNLKKKALLASPKASTTWGTPPWRRGRGRGGGYRGRGRGGKSATTSTLRVQPVKRKESKVKKDPVPSKESDEAKAEGEETKADDN